MEGDEIKCKIEPRFQIEKLLSMKIYRLPRKTKKKLRRGLWLYPPDEKGNSLMASPRRSQEDYDAMKNGVVTNILTRRSKAERKAEKERLDKPVEVSNEQLRAFIKGIFAEEFRSSSYQTLIKAKNHSTAVVAYYNFINAYHLAEKGDDSYSNVCCMAVDWARKLMKQYR